MQRYPSWPAILDDYVQRNRHRHFAYGSWDCCLFAADLLEAMTGVDLAESLRDQYDSRSAALAKAFAICGHCSIQSIVAHLAEKYELPPIAPLNACRGDLVLISRQRGRDYSAGVVALTGHEILIACKEGIGTVPITEASRAWRI